MNKELIAKILNYLSRQPYAEVAQLIAEIMQSQKKEQENGTTDKQADNS